MRRYLWMMWFALAQTGCTLDREYVGESTPTLDFLEETESGGTDESKLDEDHVSCKKLARQRYFRCEKACKKRKFECRRCERDAKRFLEICKVDPQQALALPELPAGRKKKKS